MLIFTTYQLVQLAPTWHDSAGPLAASAELDGFSALQ